MANGISKRRTASAVLAGQAAVTPMRPLPRLAVAAATLLLAALSTARAEDFSKWRCYRVLQLDTSPAGANVAGDVAGFPVAVALTAANFTFDQAKSDGSDLRFATDKDGELLPHSIEHWDAAAKSALVWVRVPLVRGLRSDQVIFLHYGNPAADSTADSAAVFGPGDGFVGVWHLDDEGGTAKDGYRDATPNAAHGTGVNLAPGARVDARVGKGLALEHARNQWVKVAGEKRRLFDLTNRLTFSIWARARSYGNKVSVDGRAQPGYETMFAKGDNSWRLQKFGIRSWHNPPADLVEICVERAPKGDLCAIGRTDMQPGAWYHFTGVHDFPFVKLYVNGVLEMVDKYNEPWTSGDHPVGIGNQSQFPEKGRAWDGVLDEARVLSVAKDQHWIKLDYESQREGQQFLRVGAQHRRW